MTSRPRWCSEAAKLWCVSTRHDTSNGPAAARSASRLAVSMRTRDSSAKRSAARAELTVGPLAKLLRLLGLPAALGGVLEPLAQRGAVLPRRERSGVAVDFRRLTNGYLREDPEERVANDGRLERGGQARLRRDHAAADVDADRVRHDRVPRREDGADGHAEAGVRVRHDGHVRGAGKARDVVDLLEAVGLDLALGKPGPDRCARSSDARGEP